MSAAARSRKSRDTLKAQESGAPRTLYPPEGYCKPGQQNVDIIRRDAA